MKNKLEYIHKKYTDYFKDSKGKAVLCKSFKYITIYKNPYAIKFNPKYLY